MISISSQSNHLTSDTVRKTEEQKRVSQKFCSQNDKHSEQMFVNNVWYLLCNSDFNAEDRDIYLLTWFVSECETDTVLIQTQEVWHEESDQKDMFKNTQQAAKKKILTTAVINAN